MPNSYSSSPNQSTAMQTADVSMSCPACSNTFVSGCCSLSTGSFYFFRKPVQIPKGKKW